MADIMVYKLYAGVTASADAAASLDILFDGMIKGMMLDLAANGADALNDGGSVEVSFGSVSGFSTNDTRSSIGGMRARQGFLTSGGSQVGKNTSFSFGPDGIPVSAGERIYMHIVVNGTVSIDVSAWLYVAIAGAGPISRRRL